MPGVRPHPLFLVCVMAWLAAATPPATGAEPALMGFTAEGSAAERALEQRFDAQLDAQQLRAWMKHLTAHPHHAGSPYGKAVADWLAAQFRDWGFDTQI